MSRVRVFLEIEYLPEQIVIKEPSIVHKLKNVLRSHKDDEVWVFNARNQERLYKIEKIETRSIHLSSKDKVIYGEPEIYRICLGVPLIKEQKLDLILEKATELGVYKFYIYESNNSLHYNVGEQKVRRWQRIIQESARQSCRLTVPTLMVNCKFNQLLNKNEFAMIIFCTIDGDKIDLDRVKDKIRGKELLILVGPEGDFSKEEKDILIRKGCLPMKLSLHILRVETASFFSIGLLNYLLM